MKKHFLREHFDDLSSDGLGEAGLLPLAILILLPISDLPLREEFLKFTLSLGLIICTVAILVLFICGPVSEVFNFFIYRGCELLDFVHDVEYAVRAVLDEEGAYQGL